MKFISNTLTVSAIASVFVAGVAFAQTTTPAQSGTSAGEVKQQDRTTGPGDKQNTSKDPKATSQYQRDQSTGSMNSGDRSNKRETKQQDRTTGPGDKQGTATPNETKAMQEQRERTARSKNSSERSGKASAKQQDRTTGPGDRGAVTPGGSIQNQ